MTQASLPEDPPGSAIVADDDEFFRMALGRILVGRIGIPHVVETGSFDEALERLEAEEGADLALFDLAMPGMHSASNLRSVRTLFPATRVVVVSGSQRREDILMALDAGVHGYIPKGLGIEELSNALNLVIGGVIFIPPSLAEPPFSSAKEAALQPFAARPRSSAPDFARLTHRQQDVLRLIVKGLSNKEIARALELGEGTVKIHLAALFRSLGVKNRAAAAVVGAGMLARSDGAEQSGG